MEMVRRSQTGLWLALVGFHRHTASLFCLSTSTGSTFSSKPVHHVGYNIFFASPYNLCHNPRFISNLLSSSWNQLGCLELSEHFSCLHRSMPHVHNQFRHRRDWSIAIFANVSLMVRPVKPDLRSKRVKSLLCRTVFVTIAFPVMFFVILNGFDRRRACGFEPWRRVFEVVRVAQGLEECDISMLWVHLLCWLLCLCIFILNFFPLLEGKATHTLFEFVYFI